MSAEQWQKVKDILGPALELRPEERPSFLAQACAGDRELRLEVESLVASFDKVDDFMEVPAAEEALKLFEESRAQSIVGRRLGQYEIIRELGHGGMGAVYLAVRADDQYQQQVAIKLVKQGFDNQFIVNRFLAERQILANLDHPHIARLLDGGTTDDGSPYLVMEYIAGLPIDAYCDEHKLSTPDRLKLFRTICSAVQYAHQNLVIHRDIKPSNILVTTDGTPKLLDFGIAKLLNPDDVAPALEQTATAMRLMTPDYASPEQVKGEPITTSTDVYSLGVLLYKLLTGHHPYRFTTPLPQEIERVICEQEPERPSTAISQAEEITTASGTIKLTPESVSATRDGQPETLRRRLRGDLDNIILMALRKEPARRYASVSEFSEDLQRHLDGLPVRARQDTFAYRSTKFVKRHKVGVAAALLIALALIGGIVTTTWQARVARLRLEAVENINSFLQSMLGSPVVSEKGAQVKVLDVLNEASQRVEKELAANPRVRASAHYTLGRAYLQIGDLAAAEKHLRAALELSRQIYGAESADTALVSNVLAQVMYQKGNRAESEALCRKAAEIYRRLGQGESLQAANNLIHLGLVLDDQGKLNEAEQVDTESLSIFRKFNQAETQPVATLLNNLGHVNYQKGNLEKTTQYYKEAIAIDRKLPDAYSQSTLATNLQNLGAIYKLYGDYAAAEPLLREAIDLRRRLLGEKHPYVAITQCHISDLYYRRGEYDKAEQEARAALAIQQAALPKGHIDLARSLFALGQALTAKGEAAQAEPLLREAVEIRRKLMAKNNPVLSLTESALGECLAAQKKYPEAEALVVGSYNDLKASQGEKNPQTLQALSRVVKLYQSWGKNEQAEQFKATLAASSK